MPTLPSDAPNPPRSAVILAGGAGERFWPLSRQRKPKQLLSICGHQSMLLDSLDRAAASIPAENTFIVTGEDLCQAVIEEVRGRIPAENVLAEPGRRNTAAALALSAAHLRQRFQGGDTVTAVLTADHAISRTADFSSDLESAFELAIRRNHLITFGIPPTRPETGFGYIELGPPLEEDGRACHVLSFREKPSPETARDFLDTGRFLWNSGMFVWRNDTLISEMAAHIPRTAEAIASMTDALSADNPAALARAFLQTDALSIDYAILERSSNVAVIPARFDWDDVGTWSSVARQFPKDKNGNAVHGHAIALDCEDSLIYCHKSGPAEAAGAGRLIVGFRLDNFAVVETDDALLVMPMDEVQNVREVVAHLRKSQKADYL